MTHGPSAASMPWSNAWQQALYDEHGFYRREEGPAGHFATSAHGIPHAAPLLARAVAALAARHDLDTVVEVGAGRGQVLSEVAASAPALRCIAVDVVQRPTSLTEDVEWLMTLGGAYVPDVLRGLSDTLVLAHEWLDVVPATVAARDDAGGWQQVCVDPATGLEEPSVSLEEAELAWLERWVEPQVQRAEVGLSRDVVWADLLERIEHGVALMVDYGHQRKNRPIEGTLTGYRDGQQVAPVPDGSMDITAHVAVDSLAAAGGDRWTSTVLRQSVALADLLEPMAMPPVSTARIDPARYLQHVAEHAAYRALTAAGGFGDFWWVEAQHGLG